MDSSASHHMTPSRESFPSLCFTFTSNNEVDDSSHISMKQKWEIFVDGDHILDVILVPNLFANLLSIYQICNTSGKRMVVFKYTQFEKQGLV